MVVGMIFVVDAYHIYSVNFDIFWKMKQVQTLKIHCWFWPVMRSFRPINFFQRPKKIKSLFLYCTMCNWTPISWFSHIT